MSEAVTWGEDGTPRSPRYDDIYRSAMGGRNILTQETFDDYAAVAEAAGAFAEPLRFMVLPPLMHGAAQWV